MRISDWSSDVCSSDLPGGLNHEGQGTDPRRVGQPAGLRKEPFFMSMQAPLLGPRYFEYPAIMLSGYVDHGMYLHFRNCLSSAPQQGLVVVEIATLGGDPEIARMMGEDIRFHSDLYPDRRLVFLGKTAVYSAGATFMRFFAAEHGYMARGTRLRAEAVREGRG